MATRHRRLGLQRGERVGIYLDKRLETVDAVFGTARAGAVFAPINPLLRQPQVAYILADCDVRLLVTTPERREQLRPELAAAPKLGLILLAGT